MSNRVEPQIPNITLDQDQLKNSRASSNNAKSHASVNASIPVQEKSVTPIKSFLVNVLPYVALASASFYFYQQQTVLAQENLQSNQRIQQLENQLSATGEEMGESTVALRVKLESISEKTELLLSEMDKLWASAWRKNQKQIKELNSQRVKLQNQLTTTNKDIKAQTSVNKDLSDKITAAEFSVDALSEQLISVKTIKADIISLTSKVGKLDSNLKTRDDQQIITATSINEFDTNLQLLIERIDRIEKSLTASQVKP